MRALGWLVPVLLAGAAAGVLVALPVKSRAHDRAMHRLAAAQAASERSQGRLRRTLGLIEREHLAPREVSREARLSVVAILATHAVLGPDGSEIGRRFSLGSGFVLDAGGVVATNRHVVRPPDLGLRVRLLSVAVYAPGRRSPFEGEVLAQNAEHDLALVRLRDPEGLPSALPLAPGPPAAGDPVVVLGYPTGLTGLLARLDERVAREVLAEGGNDVGRVLTALARRGSILPLVTFGRVGEGAPDRLVLDVETKQGGSGGPVLDARGRVLGVVFAGVPDFSGAVLAVPSRFVKEIWE